MMLKKLVVVACALLAATTGFAFSKCMYPYTMPAGKQGAAMGCIEAKAGMKLECGKWYTNFQVCKKYADDNGIPLVAVWSNEYCIHCWYTDVCFIQEDFIRWKETCNAGKVIYCFMAGGYGGYDQSGSAAYDWMWYGGGTKLNAYPFVVLWWQKKNVNERYTGDNFCGTKDLTEKSIPGRVQVITARLEKAFAEWSPTPVSTYAGGAFADPDSECDRLEFEEDTKRVTVSLSRDAAAASTATNVMLLVYGPTGTKLSSQDVAWSSGQTNATASVDVSKTGCEKDGEQLTLYLQSGGRNMSTNHITYVAREPSAGNPKWIGASFGFGEWTMDLDEAKSKVKKTAGKAYTLVSVQGSLWCPDCANVERNFLDLEDSQGNNRFAAWAKSKNVALVSIDIPNFNGPSEANYASPSLLSRTAYKTTLARAREYPQSGADPALTNAMWRSGLGYLSRKMVSDADAAKVFSRNHDLAKNNTDEGGFHRPEDGNANRTGVPIFVLLRKDGTVAARLTRMASVSPMLSDRENFDNYIKRFEEMLWIADNNTTEIGNNYASKDSVPFKSNGGSESATLCNADAIDTFYLDGFGGNALQSVTVKGDSDAQVVVSFLSTNASGKAEVLATSEAGSLKDGVALSYRFTSAGDYFVKVAVNDITSDAFKLESPVDSHFQAYTIAGHVVLEPQEDRATARPPEGSDTVAMMLTSGAVYRIAGMASCPALQAVAGAKDGYYVATVSGEASVKLTKADGEIAYQVWKPGEVGFVDTKMSVWESVNDQNDDWVEFYVERVGGKSGSVKARVTVDREKTTLSANRFVFETNAADSKEIVWTDGVTSNMTVRVKIDDDMLYEGDADIVFNLEVLSSDGGDVPVTKDKGVFTLTVMEDDKSAPGRGVITRTTPLTSAKGAVYVRESEGAKIWIERIEASDGLVAAELVSSVRGTIYETENPRDLTNGVGRTWLYFSSREYDEKYVLVKGIPAGKTANIQLKSFMSFETVAGSNSVNIAVVADDAPGFGRETAEFNLYRYVVPTGLSIALDPATLKGGDVSFAKLSGTLPAGLKVAYDAEKKAMTFIGVPTAKPGSYETVYQVAETRNGRRVPGLITAVKFVIVDPTDLKTNPTGANPAVAKARTFKDLAVVNPVNKRLAGVLQLTIPTKGNASGKYVCESGTVSLSAKSWSDFNPDTKGLSVGLSNAKTGIIVGLTANADGSVDVVVSDPMYAGVQLDAETDGVQWSSGNPATDWEGYYTVALPVEKVVTNATENLAPTGSGYVTFDLTGKSALKTGTVKWAGMLPNGTAVSGSATLGAPYKDHPMGDNESVTDWAKLPLFKSTSTDTFSVYARIQRNAAKIKEEDRRSVLSADNVVSCWSHGERKTEAADYMVDFGVYGAIYDQDEDLGGCCQEYYQTKEMALGFGVSGLVWTSYGVPSAIAPLTVLIDEDTIALAKQDNPAEVKLTFLRSSGVVTGSFYLTCENGEPRASYRGVVVTGWGEGCGCGPTAGLKTLPFVNGAFYFSDKVKDVTSKSVSVKRGASAVIDAAANFSK